nr:outer membrane protein assembly factor BamD [Phyllobacterium myrsinacearum]
MSAGFGSKARLALLLASVAGIAAISGCASKDDDLDLSAYVDTIEPADVLYNQALANLNAGRLDEAAKKFDAVDRQHPYSEFARKALVMGAFANYRAGKYDDSLAMTKRYIALYPTQPEAAYAYYITGLCYYRQIPDVTREQSMTRRSIAAFNEVVERFPQSEYVDDSKEKIRFARDQLAGKEMQVGRYYLERKDYLASIKRFRGVVEQYSNTRHIEEALARLTEAYYALGLTSEAQTAAAVLGQNYPDSQWYKDSYKLLQSGGLEPRQNAGSWLSKAAASIVGGKSGT